MKRFFLLLMAFFSFTYYGVAQSLDKALEQLELVRTQKGEQNEEYLSALDSVIINANRLNEKETAITYGKQHHDILIQLKGVNDVEVAVDLWRLGYAILVWGDTITCHDYYIEAADIFERNYDFQNDTTFSVEYASCLSDLIKSCSSLSELDNVSKYSSQLDNVSYHFFKNSNAELVPGPLFEMVSRPLAYLETLLFLSKYNYNAGNVDNALYYNNKIIDNYSIIDSSNYSIVDAAFYTSKYYYEQLRQYDLQAKTAIDHFNALDAAQVPLFDEKISALYYILSSLSNNIELEIMYGEQAKKMLEEKYTSVEDLYSEKMYLQVVGSLARRYNKINNYELGLQYHQLNCEAIANSYGKDNGLYYDAIKELFEYVHDADEYNLVYEIAPILEPMIFKYSNSPYEDAYIYCACMGDAYGHVGNYNNAIYYYEEALKLLPQISNSESMRVSCLSTLALTCYNAEKMEEALTYLSKAKQYECFLSESSNDQLIKADVLALEGSLLNDYEEAVAKFDTALLINEQLTQEAINNTFVESIHDLRDLLSLKAGLLLNKGLKQFRNGIMTDACASFQESSSLYESLDLINCIEYLTCLNDLTICQSELGNFADANMTMNKLLESLERNQNEGSFYELFFIHYYLNIGDYNSALQYAQKAAVKYKENYGEDSGRYCQMIGLVGRCYLSLKKYEEAYRYLSECISKAKTAGVSPADYCIWNRLLAAVAFNLGHVTEGLGHYNTAKYLTDSIYGPESIEYAGLLLEFGETMLYYQIDEIESFEYFHDAAAILISKGSTFDSQCVKSLFLYGGTGFLFKKPVSDDYINITTNALMDYFNNNMAYYSSEEREGTWSRYSHTKDILYSVRKSNDSDGLLYNYLLFSKSLMLSTSDRLKNAVFNTGRQDLINLYDNIQAIQRLIDRQSFDLQGQTVSCEMLYIRKTSMERRLMAEMKALGYFLSDSATYDDVRKTMKSHEIAIELMDYFNLNDANTYYVALLARSSWENPVYVQLCTEEDLKNCVGNPNVAYSTDDLYRMLWQPLSEYINEGDKVYFSPSGMLHTIALESLHTPDGSYLNDKYNLVRLTSTRELCKERQPKNYETGAVYGGLQYDVDQLRMAEVAAMNKADTEESPAFALRGEDRGNWNYLQGAKDEAEHIASIMQQANIDCNLLEGDLGSEESFKALSGGKTDIIHLATHGYFLEGEKADMNDFMKSLSPLARQNTDSVIDPLIRSGLILSGGNSAWLGKEIPEGIEDGVLTALEISTLDLSGTDLVVMSACETGLGDITSDGVFGLQRAFKMAGVQTLVMSLWKVDDNATCLMMQTFYEHLLSGKSKREAFNLAQAAVRAKYPEPYYWAGFVMLD